MSETTNSKNVRDDEIDLLDLFKRMGRGLGKMFRTLGRWLLISIVFILKSWLPLLISIIIGVGTSYLIRSVSSSTFASDIVLRTNASPPSDYIAYINRLHNYCREKNTQELMRALSVDQKFVKNIIDISAFWIIDFGVDGIPDAVDYFNKHDVHDTVDVRMQDRMDIRVKLKNPAGLSQIKSGLIQFINRDSLFQQRNRIRMRQNQEMMARLNYDISQLDSLQKIKYFEETKRMSQPSSGQLVFLQEQKTQLVYGEIHQLLERKQSIDASIVLYNNIVTVLSDFSIPAKRDNGTLFYGKKIIPVFFSLTLIILVLLYNRKKLKDIFQKY